MERLTVHPKNGLRKRKLKWSKVTPELKGVATIDLACKAESIVGKLFWSSLGVLGIVWAIYFVSIIVLDENSLVTSIAEVSLMEVNKPALTMCSKSSARSAFVERLGNFLDSKQLPNPILNWRRLMKRCGSIYSNDINNPKLELLKMKSFKHACDFLGEGNEGCNVSVINFKLILFMSMKTLIFNRRQKHFSIMISIIILHCLMHYTI